MMSREFSWDEASKPTAEAFSFEDAAKPVAATRPAPAGPVDGQTLQIGTTYDPNKINEGRRTSITAPGSGARDAMREAAKQGVNEGGGPLGIPRAARIAASGIVSGTDQLLMGAANTVPLTANTLSEAFNRMYDAGTNRRVLTPERLTQRIDAVPARVVGKMGTFNDPILADAKAMNPQSDVAEKKWEKLQGFDETAEWLGTRLAEQIPQLPLMAAGAFAPALRTAVLSTMAGTTAGGAYADAKERGIADENALPSAFVQGGIEFLSEKLPFHVFDKVREWVTKIPPPAAANWMGRTLRAMGVSSAAIGAQMTAEAGEEGAAQIGQNLAKRYIEGDKKVKWNTDLAPSMVVGAAFGGMVGLPNAALGGVNAFGQTRQPPGTATLPPAAPTAPTAPTAPAAAAGGIAPAPAAPASTAALAPAVPTEPAIAADAPDLTYQNRDRSTAASVAQMQKIAQGVDYDLVSTAKTPDVGAPLVASDALPAGALGAEDTVTLPDGTKLPSRYAVVEADSVQPSNFANGARNPGYEGAPLRALSNARTAGIRAAYPAGNAADYRARLEADPSHGVPVEQIRAMKQPMLVRVLDRKTVEGIPDFARKTNTGGSAQMGAREAAVNDSQAIGALDDLQTSDDGAINVPANRPFIRRFVGSIPESERGTVMDKAGRLTPAGETRIRNAILARAYGNSGILERLTESTDNNIRNIGNGLVRAAPDVARLRDAIAQGRREPMDIAPDLALAVEELSRLRAEGIPLEARLAQGSLVDDGYSAEVVSLLRALDSRARSAKQVADFIRGYVDAVENLGDPNQGDMLGKPTIPSRADILRGQDNELRDPAQQSAGAASQGSGAGAGPGAASIPGAAGPGGQAPGGSTAAGSNAQGTGSVAESRALAALDRAAAAAQAAVKAQEAAKAEAAAKKKADEEGAQEEAAAAAKPKKPKPAPKDADPFADDYAALDGKTVTNTVQMADGKAAKLKMDAGRALRNYDKRLKTIDALRTCLRGAA